MSDSPPSDDLRAQQERNEEQRIEAIRRWVEYVERQPPDVWGEQLNTLVNAQLQSARDADLSAEQYRRVERAGEDHQARDG